MRVKIWTAVFIILAILCLYGCKESSLSEEDMVLNPGTVDGYNLAGEVNRHFQDM